MYGFVFDAIRLGCFKEFNKKMWQDISKVEQQDIVPSQTFRVLAQVPELLDI